MVFLPVMSIHVEAWHCEEACDSSYFSDDTLKQSPKKRVKRFCICFGFLFNMFFSLFRPTFIDLLFNFLSILCFRSDPCAGVKRAFNAKLSPPMAVTFVVLSRERRTDTKTIFPIKRFTVVRLRRAVGQRLGFRPYGAAARVSAEPDPSHQLPDAPLPRAPAGTPG